MSRFFHFFGCFRRPSLAGLDLSGRFLFLDDTEKIPGQLEASLLIVLILGSIKQSDTGSFSQAHVLSLGIRNVQYNLAVNSASSFILCRASSSSL